MVAAGEKMEGVAVGKALEWLGADGCRAIADSILEGVEHRGGEIWAHCPWHQESTPGGAFSYCPDRDVAKCMSCGQAGDLIAVYCGLNGHDPDSAEGFREFRDRFAGDADTTPRNVQTRLATREWSAKEATTAPAMWHEKAALFVAHSVERLESMPDVQAELAAWGISMDTARLCRIGWNDRDKAVPRPAWGLPEMLHEKTGKPKKIWLPKGLVLPMYDDGKLVKIKIRRPEARTSWGVDLRYWEVPGGENNRFHRYGRPHWSAWVIVETERDAVTVWQATRSIHVGAMGIGGAAKRPASDVVGILRQASVILVALDLDDAGVTNSWKFWAREFPQAIRWPVPPSMGKDVGDAVRDHGLDVAAWVREGIPSHVWRDIERGIDREQAAEAAPAVSVSVDLYGDPTMPAPLRELLGLVRDYPFQLATDRRQVLVDQLWARTKQDRWALYRRAAWLLEQDGVHGFLAGCGVDLVRAKNLDKAVAAYTAGNRSVPGEIQEMYEILQTGPITINRDTLRVDYDLQWSGYRDNWGRICRLSNELLINKDVLAWIARHPAEVISAGNFWGEK
jgi:hypothetical protein